MAAVSGWTKTRKALIFTSRFLSQRHRDMADPIHIALIDDDPAVLDSLGLYLEQQELKVSRFGVVEGFLAAVDDSTLFDCVVSDVRMPGVSGLSLVRYLNTRRFARPIILITGHGDIDMAVSAIKIGAFDFIEKPFDETRLLVSIRNAVELERQHIGDALRTGTVEVPI